MDSPEMPRHLRASLIESATIEPRSLPVEGDLLTRYEETKREWGEVMSRFGRDVPLHTPLGDIKNMLSVHKRFAALDAQVVYPNMSIENYSQHVRELLNDLSLAELLSVNRPETIQAAIRIISRQILFYERYRQGDSFVPEGTFEIKDEEVQRRVLALNRARDDLKQVLPQD